MAGNDEFRGESIATRPRALIRYLGGLVGLVAGLASWIGCAYFALHPSEAIADPASVAFNVVLGGVVGWAWYRWIRIGGDADRSRATFRGFLRTLTVPTDQIANIERRLRQSRRPGSGGSRMIAYDALLDDEGREIGEVPGSLEFCERWSEFRAGVLRLAREATGARDAPH